MVEKPNYPDKEKGGGAFYTCYVVSSTQENDQETAGTSSHDRWLSKVEVWGIGRRRNVGDDSRQVR